MYISCFFTFMNSFILPFKSLFKFLDILCILSKLSYQYACFIVFIYILLLLKTNIFGNIMNFVVMIITKKIVQNKFQHRNRCITFIKYKDIFLLVQSELLKILFLKLFILDKYKQRQFWCLLNYQIVVNYLKTMFFRAFSQYKRQY